MKVLVISPTFPPTRSGGADFAFRQCELLAARGVDLHVITSVCDEVARSDRFAVSAVVRRWSWRDLGRILSIARAFKPDAVLIHFAGAIYEHHLMITVLPSLLKRWLRIPRLVLHVEHPQAIDSRPQTRLGRAADKVVGLYQRWWNIDPGYGSLLSESDVVFALCEPHRAVLQQHEPDIARKCVVIGPPPSVTFFADSRNDARALGRAELGISSAALLLVYYGYLYHGKGVETLLDAFQEVVEANGEARLLILGGPNELLLPGEEARRYLGTLKQRADALGIAESVIWTGYFPKQSDRPSLFLYAADICVLPFDGGVLMHRSTLGVAAAHGLPIVTTRGEERESVFVDGANLLLCPPRNASALAATINRLISDRPLQEQLRRGAKQLADQHFSWERCIEQTLEALAGSPKINRAS
jgi:glycosyltransferase involved in cell wall biosynthesis